MPKPPLYPWPHGKRACVSITMDNMGEAADLNRGVWPADTPVGNHHSVKTQLPEMLSLLAERSITATYFIEAWNCDVYADTIGDVAARGHEVAFHAWQHEVWSKLSPETERGNMIKSVQAASRVGVQYAGFRPPGGMITPLTLSLMKENDLSYLSPAAARPAIVDGVAVVPFQWRDIDAYFYMEATKPLRVANEDGESVLSANVLSERWRSRVDEVIEEGGFVAFLFHPFLQISRERMDAMREVLDYVRSKEDDIWIASSKQVADWVLSHRESFGDDPRWDTTQWKKK